MRILILFMLVLCYGCVGAQSICVSADCKDTVRYPQDTVTLNGVATSADGIKSTTWSITTGAGTTIDNGALAVTVARGLKNTGYYIFTFTGTSSKNAVGVAFDSVYYVGNKAPTAVVGSTINTTATTATLSGSGSFDAEGLPIIYSWSQVSGPNTAAFSGTSMANPIVSGLIAGSYVFRLTVTDVGGLTSTATQSVITTKILVKTVTTVVKYYSDGTTTTTTTTTTP